MATNDSIELSCASCYVYKPVDGGEGGREVETAFHPMRTNFKNDVHISPMPFLKLTLPHLGT